MRPATLLAVVSAIVSAASALPAVASPCAGQIEAVEKQINAGGASTTGSKTAAADTRTNQARVLLEKAKDDDRRGDVKACDETLEKVRREVGSAQ